MIKKIKTNIKSRTGQPYSVELGNCTLLIGPNESGKSGVAEACQLALTGSASGLFLRNRPVKAGNQLEALKPKGADFVFSDAELEDGSGSRWELEPGSRAKRTGVKGISLPVSELRTAFAGSTLTIHKFLYSKLCPEETSKPTLERLEHVSKEKRNIQTGIKSLGAMLSQFSSAQEVDNSEIYANWEKLFQALQFELLRKAYRKHQTGDIKKMLLDLGDLEELKSLENSADISEQLISMIGSAAVYQSARAAREKISSLEEKLSSLKEEETVISNAIREVLYREGTGLIWEYVAAVSEYLPDGGEFAISISGSFGLYQGEHFRSALSGSTEARVLAAMAAALPKHGNHIPGLIVVEDRMWDHQNLAKTMQALENTAYQVIIMTTTKPRGRKRVGWKYVFTETDFEFEEATEEVEDSLEFNTIESTTDEEVDRLLEVFDV